jgi:hypothetical protein
MSDFRLKTFVEPSHVNLEKQFEAWSKALHNKSEVIKTSLIYSSSLQKFVMSVVYTEVPTKEMVECRVPGDST